ncbi:hypothetical protein [Sinomicrobium soli]|uniref:hypothetical protein n=1 Tax=Sinomicrobium sp. N-1-3-6 TaxID=2219864 RepID=UPI000DCE9626|nr:hypothetical protein [Sinomicrobium sp. N-1-3-6]RAV28320.1 hypothetical protein DN748_14285 [Sinomicrobium sp. N-1-3-6]
MNYRFLPFTVIILIIISVLLLFSCEDTVEPEPLPKDIIEEYKVSNIPDNIVYGTIDNIENTITVYLPYYYSLDVIDPEITLAEGATLEEEILPVSVNDTTQIYTVNGDDGNIRTYRLDIVQQNPSSLTVDYNSLSDTATEFASYPNATTTLKGNLFSVSTATLEVTLIDSINEKEIPADLSSTMITAGAEEYTFPIIIPAEADSGYYDIRVKFLGNTCILPKPIHLKYRSPQAVTGSSTVIQGGNYTINAKSGYVFLEATSVTVNLASGDNINLPIVSESRKQIIVKIPDDFPLGATGTRPWTFEYSGWTDAIIQNFGLTVQAKE